MAEITLLDGGMGQELIHRAGKAPHPLWATRVMIDHPGLVQAIHADFLSAGASVATANTYAIHRDRLAPFDEEQRFAALHAAALSEAHAARDAHARATGQRARVAGSTGPLGASYRPELFPDHATAVGLYAEVAELLAPRCDLLIAETVASLANARAFVDGAGPAARAARIPLWLSVTVLDEDGTRLRSGEPISALAEVADDVEAVLANCSSPEAMDQAMPHLARLGRPFGAYANGFRQITSDFLKDAPTVDALSARPEMTPALYADYAMGWVAQGARIIGGCCEVSPDHIAEIARRLRAEGHRIV